MATLEEIKQIILDWVGTYSGIVNVAPNSKIIKLNKAASSDDVQYELLDNGTLKALIGLNNGNEFEIATYTTSGGKRIALLIGNDGKVKASYGLGMNGKKITNLAAGSANTDAATFGQLAAMGNRVNAVEGYIPNFINPNLLDNSNFLIDQRGVGNGVFTVGIPRDRWIHSSGGKEITNNANGSVTVKGRYYQKFEAQIWSGKEMTISVSDPSIDLYVNVGSSSAGVISAGSGRQSVTITGQSTVDGSSTKFYIRAALGDAVEYTFADLKLEFGEIATPFTPPQPQDSIARCQRHYEAGQVKGGVSVYFAGYSFGSSLLYKVEKAVTPTITFTVNGTQVTGKPVKTDAAILINAISTYGTSFAINHADFVANIGGYYDLDFVAETGY